MWSARGTKVNCIKMMDLPRDLIVPLVFFSHRLQTIIADHDAGTWLQCWDQSLEHLHAILVALIVAYPTEEVDIRVLRWLLGHEVVELKFDAIGNLRRTQLWSTLKSLLVHLLYNELELRILFRQGDAHETS